MSAARAESVRTASAEAATAAGRLSARYRWPVPVSLLERFSERIVAKALGQLRARYLGRLDVVRQPSALLAFFCRRLAPKEISR
jgi:hypothetical protein